MRALVLSLLVCLCTGIGWAQSRPTIPTDDSYTVSQRYYAYKDEYPELRWPELEFKAKQKILFDRRYKKIGERELHIDVFLPPPRRATHQGILFIHGGAWRSGNKSHFYAVANKLAQRGYTVFLPEYRLAPEASYPAGLIDINDALVWVKDNARSFKVDPDRIAIGGGSSGGQMAALLAYSSQASLFKSRGEDNTTVNALIDLDGVLDFMSPLALKHENAAGSASPAALWLGGAMEQATSRWHEASAARYVSAKSPPTLIISSGQARFTAGKEDILSDLAGYGIRSHYHEFSNVPHTFWLFDPYVNEVVDLIDTFMRSKK